MINNNGNDIMRYIIQRFHYEKIILKTKQNCSTKVTPDVDERAKFLVQKISVTIKNKNYNYNYKSSYHDNKTNTFLANSSAENSVKYV